LYNFFGDSTASLNQWRLVLNGVLDGGDLSDAPTFDETRHASICVEVFLLRPEFSFHPYSHHPGRQLKFLYVAITRARKNLWIMDSSERAGPMKVPEDTRSGKLFSHLAQVYWSDRNQIEIWSSTAEIPRLAVSSTTEEWLKTGRMSVLSQSSVTSNDPLHRMFLNKRYAQASVAFLRAGRKREVAICDAYLLREKARSISTTAGAARIQAFFIAANAFIACAQDSPSKQVKERLAYYGTAGECYLEARDFKNAGDSYRMAEQYATAARTYREGNRFGELVEVITQHRDVLDRGLLERLTKVAQMHYFKVCSDVSLFWIYLILSDPASGHQVSAEIRFTQEYFL